METQDIFNASPYISAADKYLATRDIYLETGSDFSIFENVSKQQQKTTNLGPKFNPRIAELNDDTAFWIIGRNGKGEVVHTQAVCIIDLNGQTLATYLGKHFSEFFPYKLDKRRSCYQSGPNSQAIKGSVCYHGEFWLKGGKNGSRGKDLTAPLTRFAMAVSLLKWSPDFIFSFMREVVICKGLAARAGFYHSEPNSLVWSVPGDEKQSEAWTAWANREDIRHLLKVTLTDMLDNSEKIDTKPLIEKAA